MRREKAQQMTHQEYKSWREKNSDYQRLWRRPTKSCVRCKEVFANNSSWFSKGIRGRLTSTCLTCVGLEKENKAVQGWCPMCKNASMLVIDRQAPGLLSDGSMVRMCRSCLLNVNTAMQHADEFILYLQWRMATKKSG